MFAGPADKIGFVEACASFSRFLHLLKLVFTDIFPPSVGVLMPSCWGLMKSALATALSLQSRRLSSEHVVPALASVRVRASPRLPSSAAQRW